MCRPPLVVRLHKTQKKIVESNKGGIEPGSAWNAFLQAQLGLGLLAFGSLGNNLARY